MYEELFTIMLASHTKYILLKNNEDKTEVVNKLGIKQLNVLGLFKADGFDAQFCELERLSLRCFV